MVSGKVRTFQNHFSICHPDFVGSVSSYQEWCGFTYLSDDIKDVVDENSLCCSKSS